MGQRERVLMLVALLLFLAIRYTQVEPNYSAAAPSVGISALQKSEQLILITSKSWGSSRGELRRFERSTGSSGWQATGELRQVLLGIDGMIWGLGLHPAPLDPSQVIYEGDRRSPAGAFSIGRAFGALAPSDLPPMKLEYRILRPGDVCIDDPKSSHYNQILSKDETKWSDWSSHEEMLSATQGYELGLEFSQNPPPAKPFRGSCIFLHTGDINQRGTLGCTLISRSDLVEILGWIDPKKNPILVQLPLEAYRILVDPWGLPILN